MRLMTTRATSGMPYNSRNEGSNSLDDDAGNIYRPYRPPRVDEIRHRSAGGYTRPLCGST